MKQIVSPNLNTTGKAGWCLAFTEDAFGTPHLYPKAIEAWNKAAFKHLDEQPPLTVSVPVYWTFYDRTDKTEYGHIAVHVPGRGVFTSPFNKSTGSEWYPSIQDMTNRINQIAGANSRYLGWSKDLATVMLVEGAEGVQVPNDGDITNAKRASTGVADYQPSGPEFDYFKDPAHGFHDLLYDTISGMNVQITKAKEASANLSATNLKLANKVTEQKDLIAKLNEEIKNMPKVSVSTPSETVYSASCSPDSFTFGELFSALVKKVTKLK